MAEGIRREDDYDYPEDYDDSKWHGVPPAGERPAPAAWRMILEITLVLLFEFFLWGIYRAATADFYAGFGSYWFYVGHIIAAPTIHLGPILIYWVVIKKERLFTSSDTENGRTMSISLGPFKMTRKFLFTAVLVGLFGGIVWRFTEMAVADATGVALGGYRAGTFWVMDLFTGSDFWLFLLMTFVMFFIVGPVEEFEFRSFVHDQSQRVLPKWAALIFSSVFFGLSHIPIAITVYKMSIPELIFAEISWMTAGAVFGALYMWSRNIFACIVMHGIGNWQLSVYYWQSRATEAGLTDTKYYIVSLVTSIVANAILIVLFFLIHKYYWEPQRRGEAAFGGAFVGIQTRFFKHDSGTRSLVATSGSLFAVTILVLTVIVGATVAVGDKVNVLAPSTSGGDDRVFDISQYQEVKETVLQTNDMLEEGNSDTYSFDSVSDRIIGSIAVTLTWEDETEKPGRPTLRRYTNQPDTMNLTLNGPNSTLMDVGENIVGQKGTIQFTMDIDNDVMESTMGDFNVTIVVTMVDAGIWTGLGLFGFTDPGNGYDLQIEFTYLQSPDYIAETTEEQEDAEE